MKIQSNHLFYRTFGFIALAVSPLAAQDEGKMQKPMHEMDEMMHGGQKLTKLVAVINPVGGSNVKGTVVFEKEGKGVRVTANIGGFEPNTKHGIHVHEFGDLGSPDASSAGGHFNPDGHDHALPETEVRHGGDLGNLSADENGHATLTLMVNNIALNAGKKGILGRAVIVHAKEDDGGQPTGNAGDRIAAGVIGISKDAMAEVEEPKDEENSIPEPDLQNEETKADAEEAATDAE